MTEDTTPTLDLQAWNEWVGDWGTYIHEVTHVLQGHAEEPGLVGGLYWPDATIDAIAPEDGDEYGIIGPDDAWITSHGVDHRISRAHVYYVAYPIPGDWDSAQEDYVGDVCDFNHSEGILIHTGNGKRYDHRSYSDTIYAAFNSHCEQRWAEGDRHGWLFAEEAYFEAEYFSKGLEPTTRDVLEVRSCEEVCVTPKFYVLPVAPVFWGDAPQEEIEGLVDNARKALRNRGLTLIETTYPNTDSHRELWGCPTAQTHYLGPGRDVYNRHGQDVTWRAQEWDKFELAREDAA